MDAYCISLQKKQDTWPGLIETFKQQGIDNIKIFPAVVGKDLPNSGSVEYTKFGDPQNYITLLTYFNLVKNKLRRFHSQHTTWSSIGCYLSHISLWQMLLDDPSLKYMLIFEDDVKFNSDFANTFQNEILPNIPANSDIVFLDVLKNYVKNVPYNEYFEKIVSLFFGLHAYIITKQGAANLLKEAFPIEMQLDSYIAKYAELNDLNLYVSTKKICKQKSHVSSVQDNLGVFISMFEYWQYIVMFLIIVTVLFVFGLFRRSSQS
jgi:GR25 family glycosyltransferase involved in LPS biosynthesis